MKKTNQMNRKTATGLLLINWSRFQMTKIRLLGSALLTGVNGTGKTTILDAITYCLVGNTSFNKAAKDRDRDVRSYVRGDTRSKGENRYLREKGEVISYIAIEFYTPDRNGYDTVGVCIESPSVSESCKSSWFVFRDTRLDEVNFSRIEDGKVIVTPKNRLTPGGRQLQNKDFLGRDLGTAQILRTIGLRTEVPRYRQQLMKMMAFNPENNIDRFIQDCVLDEKNVDAMATLREQKAQFDKIREVYEQLRQGKEKLEILEKNVREYERRRDMYEIRVLLLKYQEIFENQEAIDELNSKIRLSEANLSSLETELQQRKKDYEAALNRWRAASQNQLLQDMNASIAELEKQCAVLKSEIQNDEEKTAKLISLEKNLHMLFKDIPSGDFSGEKWQCLLRISKDFDPAMKKREAFLELQQYASKRQDDLQDELGQTKREISEDRKQIEALRLKIHNLKSNILDFPKEESSVRAILESELRRKGINTQVRFLAELVSEIKDESWHQAIETFLGRKRFYLVVEPSYVRSAMQILHDRKLYHGNLIMTDKLAESETEPDSAAEQLVTANPWARKYLNYLLNGIHLCNTLDELSDYPRGGMTRDGMLAKSYAVSLMDMRKTSVFMGKDAVKLQLLEAEKELNTVLTGMKSQEEYLNEIISSVSLISRVSWDVSLYDMDSPRNLRIHSDELNEISGKIRNITDNPDFMAVLQEQQEAERRKEKADELRRNAEVSLTKETEALSQHRDGLKERKAREFILKNRYEEALLERPQYEQRMIELYEKEREKTGQAIVLKQETVDRRRQEMEESKKAVEDAQIEYCRIAGLDISKRGISYIPYYRDQYRDVSNVKIEEASASLKAQSERLESTIMHDFVAELNEKIEDAKGDIDKINRELRKIPFGQDTYKFVMKEKADRQLFFRICRKISGYMNNPELYMAAVHDDVEMEQDIRELMDQMLSAEVENEFTDYRQYFTYDMEITSGKGDNRTEADLSEKQGSASGGEKQTPYFIILAASLMQFYPSESTCARLAFIDEAFSALSRERIEQMVQYFEDTGFQVFYAAPPEKIGSIGSYISSTVTVVASGRYSYAIEGSIR